MEPVDRFMKGVQENKLTAKTAIEVLAQQPNLDTIKSAITTLEEVVANKAKTQGGAVETSPTTEKGVQKTGEKKIPVSLINKAIRELLKAKKNN